MAFALRFATILLALMATSLTGFAQNRRQEERDAAKYFAKWLNEDVVYLISDEEREVFEKLTTDEEKERFIEQFWQSRDTDLTTAVNEYREEHYRRIAHVNRYFGSGIPGWKTDRGRIYIMFGPPDEKQTHSAGGNYVRPSYEGGGRTATYPFELWRYRRIAGVGEDIEIEFVDRSFTGEYKLALYPWEKDMLLHVDGLGETTSERLGMTSRAQRPGLHPGNLNNTTYMTRFMGARFKDRPFERLRQFFSLQRPPKIEQKELQTIVDTRLSFDQLEFSTDLYNVWIDDTTYLVPITVEVPNSSLDYIEEEGKFKARVGIYGRVTNLSGRVEAEFEDVLYSVFPRDYFLSRGKNQGSLYQKVVSLEPGRHKVDLVVKDMQGGDLGTWTRSISLSLNKSTGMEASPLVLAEQLENLDDFPEAPETFVMGDVRVVPKVGRRFQPNEKMGIYLQIYNPTLDSSTLTPSVSVEYIVTREGKIVDQFTDEEGASVGFYSPQRLVLLRKMGLSELSRGRYRLTVKVNDALSGQSSTSQADFEILGE